MDKFECAFEIPQKGIYLKVFPNKKYNYIDISAYKYDEHEVSVCLRDEQVDELIKVLTDFRNR